MRARTAIGATLLAALLANGCTTGQSKTGIVVGSSLLVIGGGLALGVGGPGGESDPEDYAPLFWVPGAIITGLSILALYTSTDPAPDDTVDPARAEDAEAKRRAEETAAKQRAEDEAIAKRIQTQQRAWALTQEAAAAARGGDCAKAKQLDVEVRGLDADFHASVFARDVAVQRCVANAPAPTPTSTP